MGYDFNKNGLNPWEFVGACAVCGFTPAEMHHVIYGTANRAKSDKYGFVIPLCRHHHIEIHSKPNQGLDLHWKQEAQTYFEEHYGNRTDFIREFGRSWKGENDE